MVLSEPVVVPSLSYQGPARTTTLSENCLQGETNKPQIIAGTFHFQGLVDPAAVPMSALQELNKNNPEAPSAFILEQNPVLVRAWA